MSGKKLSAIKKKSDFDELLGFNPAAHFNEATAFLNNIVMSDILLTL